MSGPATCSDRRLLARRRLLWDRSSWTFPAAYLDRSNPLTDLSAYLDDFRALGGNTLIAHALITPDQASFPSAIARNSVERGSPNDIVEQLLGETDRRGLAVFLSVSWDMTHPAPMAIACGR